MQSVRLSKNKMDLFLCGLGLAAVQLYRLVLSPHLGGACRFTPSCSEYGAEAFRNYSFLSAVRITTIRVLKCNPLGPHGYDPVLKTHLKTQLCKTKGE